MAKLDMALQLEKIKVNYEEFVKYIDSGNVDQLAKIVESDPKQMLPKCPNDEGNLPLHLAAKAREEHIKIVEYLVKKYAEAVMKPNSNNETPIYIAIQNGKLNSVEKMVPHLKAGSVSQKQPQKSSEENKEIPGNSLVHAVLEFRSDKWQEYLEKLFQSKEIKVKLMESCEARLSPLSSLIYRSRKTDGDLAIEAAKKKLEDLAIEVAKKYPELMKVKDSNDDETLPIHQALIYSKFRVMEAFLNKNQNFNLGTNKKGENILHLAAKREAYCNEKTFKIFRGLVGIYGLVRQKGGNKCTPLELAASSGKDGKKETNDKFLHFSASLEKPTKPNEVETAKQKTTACLDEKK